MSLDVETETGLQKECLKELIRDTIGLSKGLEPFIV